MDKLPPWSMHKCMCGDPACGQYILNRQGSVGFSKEDAESICNAMNKPEQCFEVREGYKITGLQTPAGHWQGFVDKKWLSEALTIRSVEDVRREAFEAGYSDALNKFDVCTCGPCAIHDTPAPSSETQTDELRQAKAEAWAEGHRNYLSGKNPYAAPDEGEK